SSQLTNLEQTTDSTGQPLFSTGSALQMRFSAQDVFAPVPSRADTLMVGGTLLSTLVSNAASAVSSGNGTQIATSLSAVQSGVTQASNALGLIGDAGSRLQNLQNQQASQTTAIAAERSTLEDTDFTSAIASLNQQMLTLQAAQAAFAKINATTLFNLLN
ncbi:MAG: flagellin-like protein, partial [Alphaproteobacteria bacterium]|nr:flagellin-like protein [Alphaproteobacteria bacterium]